MTSSLIMDAVDLCGKRQVPEMLCGRHQLRINQAPAGESLEAIRQLAPVVQLGYVESFSHETVCRLLKNTLKPWQVQEWCIPEVGAEFVASMEDVLDLYAEPYDPARARWCASTKARNN